MLLIYRLKSHQYRRRRSHARWGRKAGHALERDTVLSYRFKPRFPNQGYVARGRCLEPPREKGRNRIAADCTGSVDEAWGVRKKLTGQNAQAWRGSHGRKWQAVEAGRTKSGRGPEARGRRESNLRRTSQGGRDGGKGGGDGGLGGGRGEK